MQYNNNISIDESLKTIETSIAKFLSDGIKEKNYPSSSIFIDMSLHLKEKLTSADLISLHFIYNTCEKLLTEARKGNLHSSKFWIDYLVHSKVDLSDLAKPISDTIIYPATAFYKYVSNQNYDAKEDLLKAIIEMKKFGIDNNFPKMLLACVEQYLNICRINFRNNEIETATEECGNLLSYLFNGIPLNEDLKFTNWNAINELDANSKQSMIDFITKIAINKIHSVKDESKKNELYLKLFSSFYVQAFNEDIQYKQFQSFCNMLKEYIEGNYQKFITLLSQNINAITEIPNVFQFIILDKLQHLLEKNKYSQSLNLTNLLYHYFKAINVIYLTEAENIYIKSPLRSTKINLSKSKEFVTC